MKLIHTEYNLELEIKENQIVVLFIENTMAYCQLMQDLWNQVQGQEGHFILSENENRLKISKVMDCIFNPFSLNCNDRRVLNKLYQEIKEQADSFYQEESAKLNVTINNYLEHLLMQMPFALKYDVNFDVIGLSKLYHVEIDCGGGSLLERIMDYLRVMAKICSVTSYVFVGLKQYLSEEDLDQLYKFVFYEKIHLLIIETSQMPLLTVEKGWILDKDLCIIDL